MPTTTRCRICGTPAGRCHQARERMFGLGDVFTYFECAGCGCCQLLDPPADLSRYYPPGYYAFGATRSTSRANAGPWRSWAEQQRTRAQLLGKGGLWGLVARYRPRVEFRFFTPAPLPSRRARILDVGCGNGSLLRALEAAGCRALFGIDPFLAADSAPSPHVRLRAAALADLSEERFDCIMFHHSLEHMSDTLEALRSAAGLLNAGGVCIVRIPVASSEAWSIYGTDWVELDAPRHFFLHTPRSLELAARASGLEVFHTAYEIDTLPYWGSELYRRGLTLHDPERNQMRSPHSVFSPAEMLSFERRATQAARSGCGGPAAFYLRRAA